MSARIIDSTLRQYATPESQAAFLPIASAIRRHALRHWRHLPCRDTREDKAQEATALGRRTYLRMLQQGQGERVTAGAIAHYSVAQVQGGRKFAGRQACREPLDPSAQQQLGFLLSSLPTGDGAGATEQLGQLRDRKGSDPAQRAAIRELLIGLLERLNKSSRRQVELLMQGHSARETAQVVGINEGNVSRLRRRLHREYLAE